MENNSKLKTAICEFKQKVAPITKDKENPFFKSKYADLAMILDVIDAPLAEVGLVLTSKTIYEDNILVVKTKLCHKESNESEESTFPTYGNKPQEIGSSITYARRYNIQQLLNLAAEDDDGNGANNAKPIKKDEPVKPSNGTPQAAGYKTATEGKKEYAEKLAKLKAIDTIEKLHKAKPAIEDFIEKIAAWDAQFAETFRDEFERKRKEIGDVDDEMPDFDKQ